MSRTNFLNKYTDFIDVTSLRSTHFVFVLLALTLFALAPFSAAEAPITDPAKDPALLAPEHYQVVFENELIRVLKSHYGPNESSVMHRHPRNLVIALSDGVSRPVDSDGNIVEYKFNAGDVFFREALEHVGTNSSDQELDLITVEFKEPKCK